MRSYIVLYAVEQYTYFLRQIWYLSIYPAIMEMSISSQVSAPTTNLNFSAATKKRPQVP